MAAYRIKLSDGTTTIDIFGGSDTKVREGGLSMPPPKVRASYTSSPYSHGARLDSSVYDNRIIRITCKIIGSSLTDLKTNIRSIERLLSDAEQRTLLGYGSQTFIEYQWGDTDNQSTFFDILRGDLIMPNNYLSALLSNSFHVTDAVLELVCSPFGRFTNQDYAQQVIENEDYIPDSAVNYFDIVTPEAFGDVPAKAYLKIVQANAAGSKKVWIAKRSGVRCNDDLFFQGEDESSTVDTVGGGAWSDVVAAGSSGGKYIQYAMGGGVGAGETEIGYAQYDIATPPRGQFRVLLFAKVEEDQANEYTHMEFGVGWVYGDKTHAPATASGEFFECSADNTWEILDLGVLNIPPIAESDIATNSPFSLRIHLLANDAVGIAGKYQFDYIFLLPIDEGVVIIDDVAAADALAIDNITNPNNVFIISSTGVIEDFPDYVGKPFTLGRETTRFYFLRDDGKTVTFTVDLQYQPLFLLI